MARHRSDVVTVILSVILHFVLAMGICWCPETPSARTVTISVPIPRAALLLLCTIALLFWLFFMLVIPCATKPKGTGELQGVGEGWLHWSGYAELKGIY